MLNTQHSQHSRKKKKARSFPKIETTVMRPSWPLILLVYLFPCYKILKRQYLLKNRLWTTRPKNARVFSKDNNTGFIRKSQHRKHVITLTIFHVTFYSLDNNFIALINSCPYRYWHRNLNHLHEHVHVKGMKYASNHVFWLRQLNYETRELWASRKKYVYEWLIWWCHFKINKIKICLLHFNRETSVI